MSNEIVMWSLTAAEIAAMGDDTELLALLRANSGVFIGAQQVAYSAPSPDETAELRFKLSRAADECGQWRARAEAAEAALRRVNR